MSNKRSKSYRQAKSKVDATKIYDLNQAIILLKEVSYTKFTWSIECAINTNANPKYNDQNIRATVVLPHGTGKSKKIAAFVDEEKRDEASKAGADIVGNEDLLKEIQNGNINFDVLITTPERMRLLAPIAKLLWPKGLMPSPKAGTVSPNLIATIQEIKKWRIEFKLDKTGNIHGIVGKTSFDNNQIQENIESFIKAVQDHRPAGVKGKLIKNITISPTMWPGIKIATWL